jgi:RNA polymerase sigma-B factor
VRENTPRTSTPIRRRAAREQPARVDARDDDRFRLYRTTGDRTLRNELIDEHRWLAVHCAKRFANKGEPLDDLVQVALLGVLKAVERFDPDYGAAFSTFAVPTVDGELRRHFRDTTWAVHVPRRAKDLQHTLRLTVDELSHLLGRSPTVDEIAGQAGIPVEDVLQAIEAAQCYRRTPAASTGEDGSETDGLANIGDDDPGMAAAEARATVDRLLTELAPRERRIGGLTQSQIAEQVGVSQVQVSRLLRASLRRMNDALTTSAEALVPV